MNRHLKLIGIAALVAAVGLAMAGCGGEAGRRAQGAAAASPSSAFESALLAWQGAGGPSAAVPASTGGAAALNGTWAMMAGEVSFGNGIFVWRFGPYEASTGTYVVDGDSVILSHEDGWVESMEFRLSGNTVTFFEDGVELMTGTRTSADAASGLSGTWSLFAGTFSFENGNFVIRIGSELLVGTYTVVGAFVTLHSAWEPDETVEFRVSDDTLTLVGLLEGMDATFVRR